MNIARQACVALFLACSGCRPSPDKSDIFKSPAADYYYLSEKFYGHGPVEADYTRVFVGIPGGDIALVASGEYLSVAKIRFARGYTAVLCISGGHMDRYHKDVVVRSRGRTISIHTLVSVSCASARDPVSN